MAKLTMQDFYAEYDLSEKDLEEAGYLSKKGKLSARDEKFYSTLGSEVYSGRWKPIRDEYFSIMKRGANRAVSEINPLFNND